MIELWVSPRGYHPWGYLADYVDASRVIQVGAMPQNGRHPVWRLYPKVRCHLGVVPFRPFWTLLDLEGLKGYQKGPKGPIVILAIQ